MRPIVVVNETTVPLWTGVPLPADDVVVVPPPVPGVAGGVGAVPCSMTVATISIWPLAGTKVAAGNSVITLPLGASNGTLSHAETNESVATAVRSARQRARRLRPRRRSCDNIRDAKDNTLMYLEGQANQRGYALAAVLVGIALLSVVMMAMLPAWRQQVRREKEAELVFRGEQYARALYLYQRKFPGAYPPNV